MMVGTSEQRRRSQSTEDGTEHLMQRKSAKEGYELFGKGTKRSPV